VHLFLKSKHEPYYTCDKSPEWYTPPQYVDLVRDVLDEIDLDPASCAEANRIVRATRCYDVRDNGLTKRWHGRVFLNPPYGRNIVDKFVAKLIAEYEAGITTAAILLVPAHTQTEWFRPPA
jgi:ParB family chromosome partitioning protein